MLCLMYTWYVTKNDVPSKYLDFIKDPTTQFKPTQSKVLDQKKLNTY